MAKAILMSIKPKYVSMILNKIKTIEVRKHFPIDYVGWVYIYCTKNGEKPYDGLVWDSEGKGLVNSKLFPYAKNCPEHDRLINGKVVARFWCDKVEDYVNGKKWSWKNGAPMWGAGADFIAILKPSCLTKDELYDYCEDLSFSAIHIANLEIFDKPKELKNFLIYSHTVGGIGFKGEEKQFDILKPLSRAPQSWCYIDI